MTENYHSIFFLVQDPERRKNIKYDASFRNGADAKLFRRARMRDRPRCRKSTQPLTHAQSFKMMQNYIKQWSLIETSGMK